MSNKLNKFSKNIIKLSKKVNLLSKKKGNPGIDLATVLIQFNNRGSKNEAIWIKYQLLVLL